MFKPLNILGIATLLLSACAEPDAASPISLRLTDVGFETPESVLHDARSDRYLVSNISGDPSASDGNGFISRVQPDGTVEDLKWIDGAADGVTLNAPKGMAIANGKLYIADIDTVRIFDQATGAPLQAIEIAGTTFLNDVAAGPDGTVYVSDSGFNPDFSPSGTDAIYAISSDDRVRTLIADPELGGPNGLLVHDGSVWVVTFASGEMYRIDEAGQRQDTVRLPQGQLDGIVITDEGEWVVSSWEGSTLLRGVGADFETAMGDLEAPADIAIDRQRGVVLVPLFTQNALVIESL